MIDIPELDRALAISVLICLIFVFFIGIFIGRITHGAGHDEAIKHGAAHYDSKNGEFRWNDEAKP